MAQSQNGYSVLESSETKRWTIPGTDRGFTLAPGDPGFLLAYYVDWHHRKIESIDTGTWDEWGWAPRPIRGSDEISNHASGTAADINAAKHPMGQRNTYGLLKRTRIRAFLRLRMKNCLRWGGDYQNRPDDMHFEINVPRDRVRLRAEKLRATKRGGLVWRTNH
jgi:hypothetical protein